MSSKHIQFRKLGTTGFDVSTVGFGTWQLGGGRWKSGDQDASVALLRAAADAGINLFDAAVVYGQYRDDRHFLQSRAQDILGLAFASCRQRVFYCIKLGQIDEISHRALFTPERLVDQFRQSLQRLRTDFIDICLIHAPSLHEVRRGAAIAVLRTLQALGMVRAVGYSFENEPEHAIAAIQQTVDVIMLQYNLLEAQCLEAIKKAYDRGVGILVGGPYKRGYLTGRYRRVEDLPLEDDYWSWNVTRNRGKVEHILVQVNELLADCGSDRELRRRALEFILKEPGVASAVIGIRQPEEIEENLELAEGGL